MTHRCARIRVGDNGEDLFLAPCPVAGLQALIRPHSSAMRCQWAPGNRRPVRPAQPVRQSPQIESPHRRESYRRDGRSIALSRLDPQRPLPCCRTKILGSSRSRTHSVFSSRSSPAAASRIASTCPSASLRNRVSTLPRNSTASISGRSAFSCARRRWLLVPTTRALRQLGQASVLHRNKRITRINPCRRRRQCRTARAVRWADP